MVENVSRAWELPLGMVVLVILQVQEQVWMLTELLEVAQGVWHDQSQPWHHCLSSPQWLKCLSSAWSMRSVTVSLTLVKLHVHSE